MRMPRLPIVLLAIAILLSSIACGLTGKATPTATPEVEPTPAPFEPTEAPATAVEPTSLDAFQASLLDALTQTPPDYASLQSFMGGEFWFFEPYAAMNLSPAAAVAEFQSSWLPPTAAVTYDMAVDPHSKATFPLPEADAFVYTTGWGLDSSFMGILVIKQTPEGYQWEGVFNAPESPGAAGPTRVEFAAGATSATAQGNLAANGIDEYVLYALGGQSMTVTITSPGDQVYLSITGLSDGIPLVRAASDATSWTGVLPASQDYSIKAVSGGAASNYSMEVVILPLDESGGAWIPIPAGICQDLRVSVAGELGVTDVTLEENAPFQDAIGGTSGRGCLITAYGTGADFESHGDVFLQLSDMLVSLGWTPDITYDGGGPTGTLGGFRRDAGLILVVVGWEPSEDANCPQDQPIFTCPLTPEQQIYTITLSAAMQ